MRCLAVLGSEMKPSDARTDKLDDAKAKNRVREQIEADKRERAAKAAAEKACVSTRLAWPGVGQLATAQRSSRTACAPEHCPRRSISGLESSRRRRQLRFGQHPPLSPSTRWQTARHHYSPFDLDAAVCRRLVTKRTQLCRADRQFRHDLPQKDLFASGEVEDHDRAGASSPSCLRLAFMSDARTGLESF